MNILLVALQALLCLMAVQAGTVDLEDFPREFPENFPRAFPREFPKAMMDLLPRIVGGSQVSPNEFPFTVKVNSVWESNGRRYGGGCGGSIVSKKHILTAAHCVHSDNYGWAEAQNINIYAGMIDTNKRNTPPTQAVTVESYYKWPYDSRTKTNDLVVLVLSQELRMGADVQAICIDAGNSGTYAGTYGKIMGWGYSNYGASGVATDTTPNMMQKLDVEIISNQECVRMTYNPLNNSNQRVCIAYRNNKIGACMGDSGGPLVVNAGGKYKQIGLLSHGSSPCGHVNGHDVYTRLSAYFAQLQQIVGGQITC